MNATARDARAGSPPKDLGSVNTMGADANGWHGAPIAAAQLANEDAKTGGLDEESNQEWRTRVWGQSGK